MGRQAVNNAKVLPTWHKFSQLEQLLTLRTLEDAQNDTGMAVTCAQAERWVQNILSGILQQEYM